MTVDTDFNEYPKKVVMGISSLCLGTSTPPIAESAKPRDWRKR